jgi:hypothetical protein
MGWRASAAAGVALRAVSAVRPEPGIEARIATRRRSQPGCVHTRVHPKGRLRVVPPCPWRLLPLRPALRGRLKFLSQTSRIERLHMNRRSCVLEGRAR